MSRVCSLGGSFGGLNVRMWKLSNCNRRQKRVERQFSIKKAETENNDVLNNACNKHLNMFNDKIHGMGIITVYTLKILVIKHYKYSYNTWNG